MPQLCPARAAQAVTRRAGSSRAAAPARIRRRRGVPSTRHQGVATPGSLRAFVPRPSRRVCDGSLSCETRGIEDASLLISCHAQPRRRRLSPAAEASNAMPQDVARAAIRPRGILTSPRLDRLPSGSSRERAGLSTRKSPGLVGTKSSPKTRGRDPEVQSKRMGRVSPRHQLRQMPATIPPATAALSTSSRKASGSLEAGRARARRRTHRKAPSCDPFRCSPPRLRSLRGRCLPVD